MVGAMRIYVVCWVIDDRRWFDWAASWSDARRLLDEKMGDGSSEDRVSEVRRLLSCFLQEDVVSAGFAPEPRRHLPGVYRAVRICVDQEPDSVAVVRPPGALVVIAGPRAEVEQHLGTLAPHERYESQRGRPPGPRRPPTRARESVSARRALDQIQAGEAARTQLASLTFGELVWVAQTARQLRRDRRSPELDRAVEEAAALALRRERSTAALNLKAATLRDAGALQASRDATLESLALCDSPELNPFAYAGLAATLRRLGEYDEADVLVKKALRHYPDDEILGRLRRSIIST